MVLKTAFGLCLEKQKKKKRKRKKQKEKSTLKEPFIYIESYKAQKNVEMEWKWLPAERLWGTMWKVNRVFRQKSDPRKACWGMREPKCMTHRKMTS